MFCINVYVVVFTNTRHIHKPGFATVLIYSYTHNFFLVSNSCSFEVWSFEVWNVDTFYGNHSEKWNYDGRKRMENTVNFAFCNGWKLCKKCPKSCLMFQLSRLMKVQDISHGLIISLKPSVTVFIKKCVAAHRLREAIDKATQLKPCTYSPLSES